MFMGGTVQCALSSSREVYMATCWFRIAGLLLILTIFTLSTGCAHKAKVEPTAGSFLDDIFTTVNADPDVDKFSKAMPTYLQQMDGFIKSNPEDIQSIFRASGAYFGYAFCFVEDSDKEQASLLYLKGRNYALDELKRYRIFKQALNDDIPRFKQALPESLDKRDIQALYWTALNWLGWINLNLDNTDALADIPKVQAILEYIHTLDESYNNGIVHAALGTLYANRRKADGGDPEKAREEFNKAFSYTGNSLFAVHVMYAKFYAHQIQDRQLFQKTLEKVIATPSGYYPDKTFVNEVARRKAMLLLENADTYFK